MPFIGLTSLIAWHANDQREGEQKIELRCAVRSTTRATTSVEEACDKDRYIAGRVASSVAPHHLPSDPSCLARRIDDSHGLCVAIIQGGVVYIGSGLIFLILLIVVVVLVMRRA
jgi:hypothetical protein